MVDFIVSSIIGPLPSDGSCLALLCGGGKIISVQCSAVDASICNDFIKDKKIATPFRFLTDTLVAVGVKIDKVFIDISVEGAIARIFMKRDGKKLCITTSNICSAINVAMAAGKKISMTESSFEAAKDTTGQYEAVLAEVSSLWPLTKISKTELLQAMTEIIDFSIGNHASR